jgi:hypothetical protein
MVKTAVTDVIESLSDVERFFDIVQAGDRTFFPEWQTDLPEISDSETLVLNQIRDRKVYGFSNTFSTLSDINQLSDVLQILKAISQIICYP